MDSVDDHMEGQYLFLPALLAYDHLSILPLSSIYESFVSVERRKAVVYSTLETFPALN